jgi:hypothetical protein
MGNRKSAARAPSRWPQVAGAVLFAALNVALVRPPDGAQGWTATRAGFIAGECVVMLLLVLAVYGVLRMVRRASGPSLAATAAWTLGVALLLNAANAAAGFARSAAPTTLTDGERRGLVIGQDSIRHPVFGFALPNPGPGFVALPAQQARIDSQLGGRQDMAAWVVGDTALHATVIVEVTRFVRLNERLFRGFATDLLRGILRSRETTVLYSHEQWQGGGGEYTLMARHQNGIYINARCLARPRPSRPFVVCLQTLDPDSIGLQAVREGLSAEP